MMAPCIVGAPGAGATARCGLNNPISELHAGGGPPRGAPSGVASTLRAPSTLARGETVRCAPARAPCVQGPGRQRSVRSAMPAYFAAVAGKVWPAVRAVVQAAVATSQFCESCLRAATRALRWSRARVRPHKMSGRCLACKALTAEDMRWRWGLRTVIIGQLSLM